MVGCFSFLKSPKSSTTGGECPVHARPSAAASQSSCPAQAEKALVVPAPTSALSNTHAVALSDLPDGGALAPPQYTATSSPLSDEGTQRIEMAIDGLNKELRALSLDVHDHPEIAMKEHRTHDVLVAFMYRHGFDVTPHAYGIDTAFEASFTYVSKRPGAAKHGRTIGFNSEMDALPGLGHACGHNLIAIVGVAGALAVAEALKATDTSGRVVLLGTPAEENIGGKIALIKAGAYKQMDVCMMAHPAPRGWSGMSPMLAIADVFVEYTGRPAHAAGAPWQGINALDAAVLAYSNISALRAQTQPEERIHGVIRDPDGWVCNVVPAKSGLEYGVRAPTMAGMLALKKRVIACFNAAAEATGCEITIKESFAYFDVRNCGPMAETYALYMGDRQKRPQNPALPSLGSTDFGNVCYELPALHPLFGIDAGANEGNHTLGFTRAAALESAHLEALASAKGLAATGWRAVVDDGFAAECAAWFKRDKKDREADQ